MNITKLSSTPVITAIDGHQAAMTPAMVQPSLPQNLNKKGKEGTVGEKTTIITFRKHYLICKNVLCKFKDRIDTNAGSNVIYRDITFNIKIHQRFNTEQHRGNLDTEKPIHLLTRKGSFSKEFAATLALVGSKPDFGLCNYYIFFVPRKKCLLLLKREWGTQGAAKLNCSAIHGGRSAEFGGSERQGWPSQHPDRERSWGGMSGALCLTGLGFPGDGLLSLQGLC